MVSKTEETFNECSSNLLASRQSGAFKIKGVFLNNDQDQFKHGFLNPDEFYCVLRIIKDMIKDKRLNLSREDILLRKRVPIR